MNIPETAIEAAAIALNNERRGRVSLSPLDRLPWSSSADESRYIVRTVLEAALPHIEAARGRKPEMTDQTPVERATWALRGEGWEFDRDRAHAVFASIDTDQLAAALLDVQSKEIPALVILSSDDEGDRLDALELAHTIKNWLTGKEPQ